MELSRLIAPPYDVLDEAGKAKLQAKHPNNIVTVDLPFLPPKSVGPDAVYAKADTTLQSWLSSGVLVQDARPALYAYAQSYEHGGRTFHRRGFIALVKLTPFGVDVIPHGWKTGITAAAQRHFQAATANCPLIETCHPSLFASTLRATLTGPEAVVTAGRMELPRDPGLGIELDAVVVERFRVP